MQQLTIQSGLGPVSVRSWRVGYVWKEIPDCRQVFGHAGMDLRHDPVACFGRKRLDALLHRPQIQRRTVCDGLVYGGPAICDIGGIHFGQHLLQGNKEAGVGWVEHRGRDSVCGDLAGNGCRS